MPIVPEFVVRWSKVHYEQVKIDISNEKWVVALGQTTIIKLFSSEFSPIPVFRSFYLKIFKVRLLLGFRKTPKPYELYNRYHQEFHAPHCDRGHGQARVDRSVERPGRCERRFSPKKG